MKMPYPAALARYLDDDVAERGLYTPCHGGDNYWWCIQCKSDTSHTPVHGYCVQCMSAELTTNPGGGYYENRDVPAPDHQYCWHCSLRTMDIDYGDGPMCDMCDKPRSGAEEIVLEELASRAREMLYCTICERYVPCTVNADGTRTCPTDSHALPAGHVCAPGYDDQNIGGVERCDCNGRLCACAYRSACKEYTCWECEYRHAKARENNIEIELENDVETQREIE